MQKSPRYRFQEAARRSRGNVTGAEVTSGRRPNAPACSRLLPPAPACSRLLPPLSLTSPFFFPKIPRRQHAASPLFPHRRYVMAITGGRADPGSGARAAGAINPAHPESLRQPHLSPSTSCVRWDVPAWRSGRRLGRSNGLFFGFCFPAFLRRKKVH